MQFRSKIRKVLFQVGVVCLSIVFMSVLNVKSVNAADAIQWPVQRVIVDKAWLDNEYGGDVTKANVLFIEVTSDEADMLHPYGFSGRHIKTIPSEYSLHTPWPTNLSNPPVTLETPKFGLDTMKNSADLSCPDYPNGNCINKDPGMLGLLDPQVIVAAEYFKKMGISHGDPSAKHNDIPIVIYTDRLPHDYAFIALLYWLLEYYGYPEDKLHVLDGGLQRWAAEDGATVTGPGDQIDPNDYNFIPDLKPELLGEKTFIQAVTKDVINGILIDIRSPRDENPYPIEPGRKSWPAYPWWDPAYGYHIPKDGWYDWHFSWEEQSGPDPENFGKKLVWEEWKNKGVLEAHISSVFNEANKTIDKNNDPIIFYCSCEGTASASGYLTFKALGYKKVRNYQGGLDDWVSSSMDDYMGNLTTQGKKMSDGTIVVDNSWANRSGNWMVVGDDINGVDPFPDLDGGKYRFYRIIREEGAFLNFDYLKSNGKASITWVPDILVNGSYEVYVWLNKDVSSLEHTYVINYNGGQDTTAKIKPSTTGWHLLAGEKAQTFTECGGDKSYSFYSFEEGRSGSVMLSASGADFYADAVMFYKLSDFGTDSDSDGIPDYKEEEIGSDPNSNDTDGDGILDSIEAGDLCEPPKDSDKDGIFDIFEYDKSANNAAIIECIILDDLGLSGFAGEILKIETDTGTLSFTQAATQPTPLSKGPDFDSDDDYTYEYPLGLYSFNVDGASTATVTITLPEGIVIPTDTIYRKAKTNDKGDIFYTTFQGVEGLNDGDNIFTLTLIDGGDGDADGEVNDKIVDPGGPAIRIPKPKERTIGGVGDCFITTAGYYGLHWGILAVTLLLALVVLSVLLSQRRRS